MFKHKIYLCATHYTVQNKTSVCAITQKVTKNGMWLENNAESFR